MGVLESINQQLLDISQRLQTLEGKKQEPSRISFTEFARQENIARQTIYNRASRGLFQVEKIGGRNFVVIDSIKALK